MQTMNTDQPTYFPAPTGSLAAPNGYYQPNGMDPHFTQRNPNTYGVPHRMPQPMYHANNYGQPPLFYPQNTMQPNPFYRPNDPQGMISTRPRVIRPTNEVVPTGALNYNIQASPYPSYTNSTSFQPQAPPTTYYRQSYVVTQTPENPYALSNNPTQSQTAINQQHGSSTQNSQAQQKRERKPLEIKDPVSHRPIVAEIVIAPSISPIIDDNQKDLAADTTTKKARSSNETNKTEIQEQFRQQVAKSLATNSATDKTGNHSSTDEQTDVSSKKDKQTENALPRNKSSEQPQPGYPGIRTRSITEDKPTIPINQDDDQSEKQLETIDDDSKSMSDDETDEIQSTEDVSETTKSNLTTTENISSTGADSESINIGKTPSISKRFSYSKEQLLNKRTNPVSQTRPVNLTFVPEIITQPPKQKPVNPKKADANERFLRDVRSILNKLTPDKYDKLLKQLDEMEVDRYERLEGMIDIFFSKAVDEPSYCALYADLCKHFQKKQVTVPGENGQTATHYFRQILLARCQKGFENDYRADIDYDRRKAVVDAIEDEEKRKEEAENLEEALYKAKRRNFGNILFIGQLFKLGMLTDTIMYQCMEYLLRDKTDEENLECLCRLLSTIGKELEAKNTDKSPNKKILEKNYVELEHVAGQSKTSPRTRFMIQDLMDLKRADWVPRMAVAKPMKTDEIKELEEKKREQQALEQERDRQQRRDQRGGGGYNNPSQYTGSRGSRGSGMKQQSNRQNDERIDKGFSLNSLRQYQSTDKQNQGPLNFAPQTKWSKKPEDDRSNANRTGKPPATSGPQVRPKDMTSPGNSSYFTQRQPSRELARENSLRDRENAMDSLRKTTTGGSATNSNNTSMVNSRDGSRNASRDSSVNERTSNMTATELLDKTSSPPSTMVTNADLSFNEEETKTRVHSLIAEYTENYSDNTDQPVKEALEDLSSFSTSNINQQAIIVREFFTNVLEAKPRARKAVGHLLAVAFHQSAISKEGFLSGFKMMVEVVPDYAVDIPLIWQYIAEILGAFIGASSSNMLLIKPILQSTPNNKSKQLFQYIIRYATEFSSKSSTQAGWQSAGLSLDDLFPSNSDDSSFMNEYNWLSEVVITTNRGIPSPQADDQLVKLFKSINDQGATVTDDEILAYINQNMNPQDKFHIRNIVLSYLEACLVNRGQQIKIQEDIAKERMTIINAVIEHRPEAELQAVYAIQNFVTRLEHPSKMARLLFDIFYDSECVSEDTFFEWQKNPDQSEKEGHSVVVISANDFFTWLQQADEDDDDLEEEVDEAEN